MKLLRKPIEFIDRVIDKVYIKYLFDLIKMLLSIRFITKSLLIYSF